MAELVSNFQETSKTIDTLLTTLLSPSSSSSSSSYSSSSLAINHVRRSRNRSRSPNKTSRKEKSRSPRRPRSPHAKKKKSATPPPPLSEKEWHETIMHVVGADFFKKQWTTEPIQWSTWLPLFNSWIQFQSGILESIQTNDIKMPSGFVVMVFFLDQSTTTVEAQVLWSSIALRLGLFSTDEKRVLMAQQILEQAIAPWSTKQKISMLLLHMAKMRFDTLSSCHCAVLRYLDLWVVQDRQELATEQCMMCRHPHAFTSYAAMVAADQALVSLMNECQKLNEELEKQRLVAANARHAFYDLLAKSL